ncbi:MAG: hypothetical protein FVQ84_19615 [Planctomycetes bacterium]|nr:hypothetical protein [Planctomycetota bacterium]
MAAVAKTEWMHMMWEYVESNTEFEVTEPKIKESWTSVNPKRNITVYNNGKINFTEYSKNEITTQKYDVETNLLTTRYISTSRNYSYINIIEMVLVGIAEMKKRGATVEYIDSVYNGQPAKIINIDNIDDDNNMHFKTSTIADVRTRLPIRSTVISEKQGHTTTVNIIFNYPQTGPTDIYQAGAPPDAEVTVIGQKLTPEFLEMIRPYRQARESLRQQRIVVEVANDNNNHSDISIEYSNGINKRIEQSSYIRNDTTPWTEDFKTILDWANRTILNESGNYRIQINDGAVVHGAYRSYFNPWTREELSLSHFGTGFLITGLINRGWPTIRTGAFIENDYAVKNNLLCIETMREPRFTSNSKLAQAAEKTLYYLDPEHDYICIRIERFSQPVPPPYGNHTPNLSTIEPIDIPLEPYLVTEAEQLSATETGHWYPSRIKTKNKQSWTNPNMRGWEMREKTTHIRLYIDTNPEFPEGIFDPNNLPKEGD